MPAHILTIDIYDSHTKADKIDRLLYKKKLLYQLQFTTAYYSYKGHDPWHTLYNWLNQQKMKLYLHFGNKNHLLSSLSSELWQKTFFEKLLESKKLFFK